MQYLFQVSIGPVQNFIAAARRTRDLKFGSDLLSELSKAAAKQITETYGTKSLIFPAPVDLAMLEDKNFNVANKIVALIEADSSEALNKIGERVREAVLKRLHKLRDDAYEKIKGFREIPDSAKHQIDDLVEYFWVVLPFQEGHYKVTRENLEALMAARKNTRDFAPVKWGTDQQKSSIDGQLESVIPNDLYPRSWEKPETQKQKAHDLYTDFHANAGERLSGVDLLKRYGPLPTGDSFPSTSHFANIPFLERLKTLDLDNEAKKQLRFVLISDRKREL